MGREAMVSDKTRTQDQTAAILIACCFDTGCPAAFPKKPLNTVWPKIERVS